MRKVFICCVFLWMFDTIASSFLWRHTEFSCSVQHETMGPKRSLLLQQTGKCDFHAPNWFAFISDDPHKPSLYLQPKQMVVIDPQLEQVMISLLANNKMVLHLFQQSKTAWLHQFHLHKNGHASMLRHTDQHNTFQQFRQNIQCNTTWFMAITDYDSRSYRCQNTIAILSRQYT